MRYGIFSDIHSNLEALQAVVKAYRNEKIDRYLCLGDVVGYGANPNECVALTADFSGLTIAGNHDWAMIGLTPAELFNEYAQAAVTWTISELNDRSRAFLRELKLVHEEDEFALVHGSLDSPGDFNYLLTAEDCSDTFRLMRNDLCFVGHTHVPGIFARNKYGIFSAQDIEKLEVESGTKYIVNVGSVGQPRDGIAEAAYCIWDSAKREIRIKRAAYDTFAARQKIIDKGLPDFLGNRLLVGN